MKLIQTKCALCNSVNNYHVLYKRNFRASDFNTDIFSARRLPDRIHYQMVKCNYDGLVRSTPILTGLNLEKLYKDSKFTYEEEVDNLTTSYLNSLSLPLSRLSKAAHIVEIGCGNGFLLNELRKKGYKNIFGIEPSYDAVRKADKRIKNKIKVSILKRGLFKPATFDFIFFFQTLDHIPNPNNFLAECYRLLKPGGYILAFQHNIDSLSSKILKDKSPIIDIEHTYLYSPSTIANIFEKHGFKPDKIYSPTNVISLKHLVWLLPLPKSIKVKLLTLQNATYKKLLKQQIHLKLGNLCIIAKK